MHIKKRIIKKSTELFISHGIKSVSVDEIALSLGISKRTIYENFRDKEDILIHCLEAHSEQQCKAFLNFEETSGNVIEVLLMILNEFKFSDIPSIKFFEDIEKYYPKAKRYMTKKEAENFEFMRSFLKKGMEEKVIRDNLNVEIAAYIVQDTHSYIFMRAMQSKSHPFSFQELILTMSINFLRGISTPMGIEIIDNYLSNNSFKL